MPGSRRTRHNRVPRDTDTLRRHALEQIPTPPMTVHQKFKFLEHIAKVFFFILQEFMNNQQNRPPHRSIPDFPEAFHRSLFDLRILTDQFLESSAQENYHLAARILHLMANASTEDEDQLLQFALQELRHRYPQTERSPITTLIEWLWDQHQESLRRQPIDPRCCTSFLSHHVVKPGSQSEDLRSEICSKKMMLIPLR